VEGRIKTKHGLLVFKCATLSRATVEVLKKVTRWVVGIEKGRRKKNAISYGKIAPLSPLKREGKCT